MSDRAFRLAALKLYSLHSGDRAWILRHLDDGVRARLGALLKELKSLGIQSVPGAIDAAGLATAAVRLDAALLGAIDELDDATAFAALDGLPLRVKALILYAHRWRWTAAVWPRLSDLDRKRLIKAVNSMPEVRPAAMTAVLTAFSGLARKQAGRAWAAPL